mgnify:CR=1 FL=1
MTLPVIEKPNLIQLKTFANIKDEVAFIGQGYYFQIVNPSVALDLQKKSRMRLNLNKKTLGKITFLSMPPKDFSLDLYAYYMAKKSRLRVKRFPVVFAERAHGVSNWNVSFISKYHFIKRTLLYSFSLKKRMR